jgi:ADP-dependent NAD(P)H-hydrate dehydratase / NAD(P)H-hydrate epimerase
MKPVLSREQMRAYDRYAVETCHVPGLVLMENAGRGAADVIAALVVVRAARVVVVCGGGNNGGDGFVVARHLLARGADTHVLLTASSEQVTGDARINHDAYIDLGGRFTEIGDGKALAPLDAALTRADVIVDAVFGTGLGRPVQEHLARVIEAINAASGLRVSLDLPSGLDADTGSPLGAAVQAHHTVTFGHPKVGLLTPVGASLAGEVHVVDLGVPESIVAHTGHVGEIMDLESVASWIRPRETNVFKHAAGSVAIVAGSHGKVGAALLGAEAALRAGAGLCTVVTWSDSAAAVEARALEFMTARIEVDRLESSLDDALRHQNTLLIGPGIGLDERARRAVEHVVLGWEGVKVVDADALTHFAGRPEALASARGALVLTPHSGEMGRLLGCSAAEVENDRFGAARAVAAKSGAVVLLKGARTIVASPQGVVINTTGNPALATAGSGDVLAGIIAALACTLSPDRAAAAGAFIHGRAADRWRDQHGGADRGMLASEIARGVPDVMGELLGSADRD